MLLYGSLGALQLSAGELEGSLKSMEASMRLAREIGLEQTEAVGERFVSVLCMCLTNSLVSSGHAPLLRDAAG